jgi:hypothetical protein
MQTEELASSCRVDMGSPRVLRGRERDGLRKRHGRTFDSQAKSIIFNEFDETAKVVLPSETGVQVRPIENRLSFPRAFSRTH